ncbi:hypothetical protein [Paenibacillus nasutitermitis]|uniref:Uncharacterized protein n=1 Tax=Paenibacillus nasutitermitis TaxID=1652958 RepID=A0A917DMN6_9BACL|nr:hypothetical protein [Paenibacillus nasutitermitis]GGD51147.1 hypothetical protein GCM10010911_05870 [Paenibacillus nasutitermitis]
MRIFLKLAACTLLLMGMAGVVYAQTNQAIVEPGEDHTPVKLEEQATLGQDFIATQAFNSLLLPLPTWSTTTSGFTFTLRKHGPSGEVVFTQDVTNAADNKSEFQIPEQGIGRYYAEISQPAGQIGWWTRGDVYERGTAYSNGKPVIGNDRELIISLEP